MAIRSFQFLIQTSLVIASSAVLLSCEPEKEDPQTTITELDTDQDSVINRLDDDDDNDGYVDSNDAFPLDSTEHSDLDLDGIGDNSDLDIDGDTHLNNRDSFPLDANEWADLDLDGIGDNSDSDIDGDTFENEQDLFPLNNSEWADTDLDGIGNNSDTDIDGDTHLNNQDSFPLDANEWADLDLDGIGDNSDSDIDGDTFENEQDSFPLDANEWADLDLDGIGDNSDSDIDGDTFENEQDLFPLDNSEWADTDLDGIGDNSDDDIDGDTYLNDQDLFPLDANEWADLDLDGIGDNSDRDLDGDGTLNHDDHEPLNASIQKDTDHDGIDDSVDPLIDSDFDLVADSEDAFPNNSSRSSCDMPNDPINYGQQQLRLLLNHEYTNTIYDLFGIEIDQDSLIFDYISSPSNYSLFTSGNEADVSISKLNNYTLLANSVVQQFSDSDFSLNEKTESCIELENCETVFIDELLPTIFRRNLTNQEKASYSYFFNNSDFGTQLDEKSGLSLALRTALTSPNFLFRSEMGEEIEENKFKLTQFEMASFLSYTFTGSTPDDELLNAAQNNQLNTDDQITSQIERLLETDKAVKQMNEFATQWLGSNKVLYQYKDLELFPHFTDDVKLAMAKQQGELFTDTFFNEEDFNLLFSTDYAFVNQVLLDFYTNNNSSEVIDQNPEIFSKVFLPQYAGLTTSGAYLTSTSKYTDSSILQRAAFIREVFLCQSYPNFPSNVDFNAIREQQAQIAEDLKEEYGDAITQKDLLIETLNHPWCILCHETTTIPLGLGLEDYDAVGLYRTEYSNGLPITFTGPDESIETHHSALYGIDEFYDRENKIEFEGAKQLGDILGTSDAAKSCYATNAFRFVMGEGTKENRSYETYDSSTRIENNLCTVQSSYNSLLENGDSLKAVFIKLSLSDLVRYRTNFESSL